MADEPTAEWRSWLLRELKHSLQELAMPSDVQTQLFPPFAPTTIELVEHFDYCIELLPQISSAISDGQWSIFKKIGVQIELLASDDYFDTGLENQVWQEIRGLAAEALKLFGWPLEPPPSAKKVDHN